MNILLINHYAGSPSHGMEFRPYYLAREWVRMGHQVRIVASDQSHIRARGPDLKGADRLEENISGIQYTWLKMPAYTGNGVARVWNMVAFVYRLFIEGRQIAQAFKPDVVIASSTYPMDIWPAHRIAKLSKAKLVFEVHDLWPLSPMELGGMSKWHPFIMLVQAGENYAYRQADVVISILPKVRDYMVEHGMLPHKLHIVSNGIDPAEWAVDAPPLKRNVEDVLAKLKSEGNFIVGYAGSHGVSNSLDTLLDAAKLMKNEKIVFVLVGGGPDKSKLKERANIEKLWNVYFIDPVPKEQIPELLTWFDVAYIGWHRQPLYRFGIAPNKLMDYMMAGKPILHAVEAGNDPVSDAGCGLTVQPENPQAVVTGILSLFELSIEQRQALGLQGREFVKKHHTYQVLAQRFMNACR